MPGFRKGKVPPQVVIQQVGPRGGARPGRPPRAPALVRGGGRPTPASPRSATRSSTSTTCPRRARRSRSRSRWACRPQAEARRVQGRRGRPARGGGRPKRRSRPSSSALRESLASLETVERAAGQGRLRGDRLRRARSTASRSRAATPAATCSSSARTGSSRASRSSSRAPRRATTARSRSPSPTTTGPSTWPARRPSSRSTVKEVKEKRLPELDDDFAVEAGGFDSLDELREEIARAPARGAGARDRGASSARRPSTRPRPTPRSTSRTSWCTRRRTRCGTGPRARPAAAGASTRERTCRYGQDRGGAGRASRSPTPSAPCAARRCSRPWWRPRASRCPTTR